MKFVCGYCGKSYEKVEDRMNCEVRCAKKNAEKKKTQQLDSLKAKLNDLRNQESELVTKLQSIKNEIRKIESKISVLKQDFTKKKVEKKTDKDCNDVYEVNGRCVSEGEFFNTLDTVLRELDELGEIFN